MPEGAGRQEAVIDGMNTFRFLFGEFETIDQVKLVLKLNVNTEFSKQNFIQAVDGADGPAAMVKALEDLVSALSEDRQDLIELLGTEADNPRVAEAMEALQNDPYTIVLKAASERMAKNPAFAADLAEKLLTARDAMEGDHFFGVNNIVAAIDAASESINYLPSFGGSATFSTNEDTALVSVDIGASDIDGDALIYTIKEDAGAQKGSVTIANGKFTYSPFANVNGTDSFTVVVTDGKGESVERTIKIGINPVNDAPGDISLTNAVVAENSASGTLVGSLSAFDLDGDASFNFALVDDAGGRFAIQNGNLVVANGLGLDYEQATAHAIVVRATDGNGLAFDKVMAVALTDVASEKVAGTATSDVIVGGGGRDAIAGGLGKDILTGGNGKDTFVFSTKLNKKTNVDKITDFKVKDDTIKLDNSIFKKLGKGSDKKPGKLDKDFFTIGSKAQDANDYLIYDKKKGTLSYDADGSGKGAAVLFATMAKNLKMTEKDFLIV
jgi:Ca2+-binding RTX toxin-like protein